MQLRHEGTAAIAVLVVTGHVSAEDGWVVREELLKAAAEEPELLVCDTREASLDPKAVVAIASVTRGLDPWPLCPFVVLADEPLAPSHLGGRGGRAGRAAADLTVAADLASAAVLPDEEPPMLARRHLDATLHAPGAARRFLASVLHEWGHDDDIPVAALIANELITNAVMHAGTAVDVGVSLRAGRLAVTVADGSDAPLQWAAADDLDEAGRGLALVDGLAAGWGTFPRRPCGKVVWALVSCG